MVYIKEKLVIRHRYEFLAGHSHGLDRRIYKSKRQEEWEKKVPCCYQTAHYIIPAKIRQAYKT